MVISSKQSRRFSKLAASLGTTLALVVTFVPASPATALPACGAVLVAGSQWLGGAGVDVNSNGANRTTGNSCAGTGTYGYQYQCVELANRLYQQKGWGVVRAADGPASSIPEGTPQLTWHYSDGYVPVPGDLIVENMGPNAPFGHVSVVDSVVGNQVNAVEQNANWSGRRTYTLSGNTLTGANTNVRAIGHSPKNGRDLAYVKWRNPGSGRIELHTATASSTYKSFGGNFVTPLSPTDRSGVFDMADVNGDGRSDLVYINRRNTGSGRFEIHAIDGSTGYGRFAGNWATPISSGDDANGQTYMADMNADGRADLVFVKTTNTGSRMVELHWVDAGSGFSRFGGNLATAFSPADAGNGYFQPADMNGDRIPDLTFIKIRNTGSGRIEFHWVTSAGEYWQFGGSHATALAASERFNGWFESVDMNADGRADLVFLKDYNVASGRVELHWLDAAKGFSSVTFSAATVFSAAEAGGGFFTMI